MVQSGLAKRQRRPGQLDGAGIDRRSKLGERGARQGKIGPELTLLSVSLDALTVKHGMSRSV
jgi:hypothetical protein